MMKIDRLYRSIFIYTDYLKNKYINLFSNLCNFFGGNMKYLVSELYNEFECIGGDCLETCCGGWNIYVDDESYDRYTILPKEQKEWILSNIEEKNGRKIIRNNDNGFCPMLNDEGWCLLYKNISPDALCETCRTYPRLTYLSNDLNILTLSLACSEVVRLMLKHDNPLQFYYLDDEIETSNISCEWEVFNEIVNAWIVTLNIIQNRSINIIHRLLLSLEIANDIDEYIKQGRVNEIRNHLENYSSLEYVVKRIYERENSINKISNEYDFIKSFLDIVDMAGCENKSSWMNKYNVPVFEGSNDYLECKRKFSLIEGIDVEYEHISTQFLFKEWMNATNGESLFRIMSKNIINLFLVYTQEIYSYNKNGIITEDEKTLIISRLARIMEHSELLSVMYDILVQSNEKNIIYSILYFMK